MLQAGVGGTLTGRSGLEVERRQPLALGRESATVCEAERHETVEHPGAAPRVNLVEARIPSQLRSHPPRAGAPSPSRARIMRARTPTNASNPKMLHGIAADSTDDPRLHPRASAPMRSTRARGPKGTRQARPADRRHRRPPGSDCQKPRTHGPNPCASPTPPRHPASSEHRLLRPRNPGRSRPRSHHDHPRSPQVLLSPHPAFAARRPSASASRSTSSRDVTTRSESASASCS